MAIYNEILSARFGKLSQKLFSMKGEQAVKQLSGELMLVQNLPFGVEHRYLLLENRFGTTVNITGGAAQFAAFRLRNPVGSGILGVIELLTFTGTQASTAASVFNMNLTSTNPGDLSSASGSIRLDPRSGASGPAIVNTFSTTLGAAVSPNIGQYGVAGTSSFQVINTENQEITLLPGDTWTVGQNVSASNMIVSLFWRERPLEESERQ